MHIKNWIRTAYDYDCDCDYDCDYDINDDNADDGKRLQHRCNLHLTLGLTIRKRS